MAKVYLDIGHGGSDSGACGNGLQEKNINLNVGLYLIKYLQACGITYKACRTTDTTINLMQRCKDANNWGADLYVSLHHNAGGGTGYEVYHSIYYGNGTVFAKILAEEYKNIGQIPHGAGVMSRKGSNGDYYCVIRETSMPAIISEFGYIDSADVNKFNTDAKQKAEAKAIAKAICRYFGIIFRDIDATVPTPPAKIKILYRVQVGAYSIKANADKLQAELKSKGIDCFVKQINGLYKVQCGAYSVRANADAMANRLKSLGYSCFITQ
jgi:N-acetylmuramoyl-L-alanine amidase